MKKACIILGIAVSGMCLAEPEVQAVLTGVRCIYSSPHDGSGRRIELQVELRPTKQDWQVNEAGSRTQRIHGIDQFGNRHTSAPCAWERRSDLPHSCIAHFLFPLLSKVEYLRVDEFLRVQIARQALRLPQQKVNMLEQSALPVPGVEQPIHCVPSDSNAAPSNREPGGFLRRADITLRCPAGISILRVSRIWLAETSASEQQSTTPVEYGSYSQDLEVHHTSHPNGESSTAIVLWNALPSELLEIEICRGQHTVRVPLKCRAMLGDPVGAQYSVMRFPYHPTYDSSPVPLLHHTLSGLGNFPRI